MLALYEVSSAGNVSTVLQSGCTVPHKEGPFHLTSSGTTGGERVCVEYVGARDFGVKGRMRSPFSEKDLQYIFELDLRSLYRSSPNKVNAHLAFLSGPLAEFPLLSCTIGTQAEACGEKASARRAEILSLSNASQQRQQKRSVLQPEPFAATADKTHDEITQAVKSRTQSLFERIATKQAINASSSLPTAASILRQHAVGRIGEIVEILRMKQRQKSVGRNYLLSSANTTSPTRLGQRISFSVKQLQTEIRDSASVPVGDEEIRLCLKMLAEERTTRNWLKILENGVDERMPAFVVLEGDGIAGRDVQKMLEEEFA